jgi:hypothetical protein
LEEKPQWKSLIKPGLDKLKEYEDGLPSVPAYIVAMGVFQIYLLVIWKLRHVPSAIDPRTKLSFYSATSPTEYDWAKKVFLKDVSKINETWICVLFINACTIASLLYQ